MPAATIPGTAQQTQPDVARASNHQPPSALSCGRVRIPPGRDRRKPALTGWEPPGGRGPQGAGAGRTEVSRGRAERQVYFSRPVCA